MKRFEFCIAVDVPAYGTVSIAAETQEEADEIIVGMIENQYEYDESEPLHEAKLDVEWEGSGDIRVVDPFVYERGENNLAKRRKKRLHQQAEAMYDLLKLVSSMGAVSPLMASSAQTLIDLIDNE